MDHVLLRVAYLQTNFSDSPMCMNEDKVFDPLATHSVLFNFEDGSSLLNKMHKHHFFMSTKAYVTGMWVSV